MTPIDCNSDANIIFFPRIMLNALMSMPNAHSFTSFVFYVQQFDGILFYLVSCSLLHDMINKWPLFWLSSPTFIKPLILLPRWGYRQTVNRLMTHGGGKSVYSHRHDFFFVCNFHSPQEIETFGIKFHVNFPLHFSR